MIITFEQLQQSTGYNKPAEVANLLTRNNIKYLRGKNGRPFTTLDALNVALGIKDQVPTVTENLTPKIEL